MITSDSPDRPYSTRLRTALVLTGTGTAGAYHAGVLRALHEAGQTVVYSLVMPEDANVDDGLISTASPIGRALLNKEEGDDIVVTRPDGTERRFELVKLATIHDV